MKPAKLTIAIVILAIAVAAPLLIRIHAAKELRNVNGVRQRQAGVLAQLSAENKHLSNLVAQVKLSQPFSDTQLAELLKLRNEVSQLRRSIEPLQSESLRIREALPRIKKDKELHDDNPTAVRPEVPIEVRQARVTQLRKWLEGRPEEIIPELQFLSEDKWLARANSQPVTDEDYGACMTAMRAESENIFTKIAFSAVKQFAKDNNGQFPTELSQLQAYFDTPVDDAIIRRYTIIASKRLNFLGSDWKGGDWVITQKEPVNAKRDPRTAIGLGTYLNSVGDGRWETMP